MALSEYEGKCYALGKSNYPALNRVYGPFGSKDAVAKAFAHAYVSMQFTPLYFGFFDPQVYCPLEEIVNSTEPLNGLCDFMMSNYQYAFTLQSMGS